MATLQDLKKQRAKEKEINIKKIDRRQEFIERMKKDPDFIKYFITEVKKELRSLDSIASLSQEVNDKMPIEIALMIRAEKSKVLKKIFKPFLS